MGSSAKKRAPAIYQMSSETPSQDMSSTVDELLSGSPQTLGQSSKSLKISAGLDEEMEEALNEEEFFGVPDPEAEDLGVEDLELGEGEEPPTSTPQSPQLQYHLVVSPPGGSPIYRSFDDLTELVKEMYVHIETALLLKDFSAWRIYAFAGERMEIVGDLSTGLVGIKYRGEVTELPKLPMSQSPLPAGLLAAPSDVRESERVSKSMSVFDMDNDDGDGGDLF